MQRAAGDQIVFGMDLEKSEVGPFIKEGPDMPGLEAHARPWGQAGMAPGSGSARRCRGADA